jgi:hypothetical protein
MSWATVRHNPDDGRLWTHADEWPEQPFPLDPAPAS